MKIVEHYDILNPHLFNSASPLITAWNEVKDAIEAVDWPLGSGKFTISPSKHGNGVTPIKKPCIEVLQKYGWHIERFPDIGASLLRPGDLDALKSTDAGAIAFEWETGNISSSHRALNKLFLTMQRTNTLGSFLVVPSDNLKKYLTDRIGNIRELKPYFPLWQSLQGISGALRIIVIEHDNISDLVPKIPKGTDGRARQ